MLPCRSAYQPLARGQYKRLRGTGERRLAVRQCKARLFCAYDIERPIDSEARLNPAVLRSRCSLFGCSVSKVSVLAEDNAANMRLLVDQHQAHLVRDGAFHSSGSVWSLASPNIDTTMD